MRGGRKRQTLSTTKYVLLQATAKLPETKAIPQPVGAPQGSVPGSLPPRLKHLLGTLTLLAAVAEEKFAGGCSRSDGHRDHLVQEVMLSLRYEMAEQQ